MKILLLHQNFPGQFRQLTPYLLNQGHQLVAICSHQRDYNLKGVRILRYLSHLRSLYTPGWLTCSLFIALASILCTRVFVLGAM